MSDPIVDRDIMTNYSIDLAASSSKIIKISAKIATIIVDVNFIDSTGSAEVYSSIDSNSRVNAVLDGGDDDLQWTLWDLGSVTPSSTALEDVAYAPNALKFVNTSSTETVRFNYRGNFA